MAIMRTSETSAYFDETTRRYILEDCHLHTRRSENLKYHDEIWLFILKVMLGEVS
jgi:hypothetical protein